MVELDDEGDPVHVAARHHAERAQGRGHGIALARQRQFQQVGRIEVGGILGEAGRTRVLDALIDRQNGEIPRAPQPTVVVERAHVPQHARRTVAVTEDPAEIVGSRQDEAFGGKRLGTVPEQGICFVAQQVMEVGAHASSLTEPPRPLPSQAVPTLASIGAPGVRRPGAPLMRPTLRVAARATPALPTVKSEELGYLFRGPPDRATGPSGVTRVHVPAP